MAGADQWLIDKIVSGGQTGADRAAQKVVWRQMALCLSTTCCAKRIQRVTANEPS